MKHLTRLAKFSILAPTVIVVFAMAAASAARAEDLFDIKPMADGVYAAIAKHA